MDKYINKLKHILDSDKKTQNLVLGLCLIVALLIVANYTLNAEEEVVKTTSNNIITESVLTVENRLEEILGKINGISEVSVMINYSTTDKIIPVYDVKENIDEENSNGRTSIMSITEKSVAYQEGTNGKTLLLKVQN